MKDLIETLEEYANGFTNVIAPPEEDVKELLKHIYNQEEEIERLNDIINELKQKLNLAENILYDYLYKDKKITKELYNEFKELKGDGSNE